MFENVSTRCMVIQNVFGEYFSYMLGTTTFVLTQLMTKLLKISAL